MRVLIALLLGLSLNTAHAADNSSREFIMSCTYGVMAGTLVGAASLAFTNRPGDHLNRVARGASLGLYTGILLGVYVVYVIPSLQSVDEDVDPVAFQPRFWVEPLMTADAKFDGMKADWTLLKF